MSWLDDDDEDAKINIRVQGEWRRSEIRSSIADANLEAKIQGALHWKHSVQVTYPVY